MSLKGRHWVLLWLLLFVGAAGVVVARQTAALAAAARVRVIREERLALEARRADLERQIRQASSRQVLVPLAESRLGMHLPADSELKLFRPPARPAVRR